MTVLTQDQPLPVGSGGPHAAVVAVSSSAAGPSVAEGDLAGRCSTVFVVVVVDAAVVVGAVELVVAVVVLTLVVVALEVLLEDDLEEEEEPPPGALPPGWRVPE